MRRLFKRLSVLILAASIMLCCACTESASLEEPLKIWFATDIHYLSPSLFDDGGTIMNVALSGDGKITHYSPEITDAFLDKAKAEKPSLLILAGDLTLNGAAASHRELSEKLSEVEKCGVEVLVLSGNHDLNGAAYSFIGEEISSFEAVTSEEFFGYYKAFGYEEALSKDELSNSYVYEASGNLRIFMLDTNALGKGFLNEQTLLWLEDELKAAKKSKARVITVTHQNLFKHNELLSFGYQLYNYDKLVDLLNEYKVKCHLSGHMHTQSIKEESDITEIVTSALPVAPLQYGELLYDGKTLEYTAKPLEAELEGVGNASAYATEFFEKLSKNSVLDSFSDSNLSDQEIQLLAETYAKINTLYFAGKSINEDDFKEGLALWRKQEGFILSYIETMLDTENDSLYTKVSLK